MVSILVGIQARGGVPLISNVDVWSESFPAMGNDCVRLHAVSSRPEIVRLISAVHAELRAGRHAESIFFLEDVAFQT